ncbi:MAG: hypothetical protein ACYSUC_08835 [Planctomycetota bacterium]|jgi:outer membrane murein-binding lipoprotein Lpp
MRRLTRKNCLFAVGIVVGIILIAGCEQQNQPDQTPSEKMSRLIAAENIDLKKQIEQQKVAHARDIQKQKKLLDKCLTDRKALEKRTKKEIERQVNEVVSLVIAKNGELRQENQELKTQIDELKRQLDKAGQ